MSVPLSRLVLRTRSFCLSGSGGCAFGDSIEEFSPACRADDITCPTVPQPRRMRPRASNGRRKRRSTTNQPSPDGSRPGTYYVNLYDLRDMSKTELEALAYHEGVPGHHLQRAVQTELTGLPPFRRFGGAFSFEVGSGDGACSSNSFSGLGLTTEDLRAFLVVLAPLRFTTRRSLRRSKSGFKISRAAVA